MKPLTPRQHQIVALMSEGMDHQQIGDTLQISVHTVKNHIDEVYARLDIKGVGNPGYLAVALYASGRMSPVRSTDRPTNN